MFLLLLHYTCAQVVGSQAVSGVESAMTAVTEGKRALAMNKMALALRSRAEPGQANTILGSTATGYKHVHIQVSFSPFEHEKNKVFITFAYC